MDSSLIAALREKISSHVKDPGQSAEILGLIDSLVAELPDQPDEAASASWASHLHPEKEDPETRTHGLTETLEQLEISHPKAAELFHRVAHALSNLGI